MGEAGSGRWREEGRGGKGKRGKVTKGGKGGGKESVMGGKQACQLCTWCFKSLESEGKKIREKGKGEKREKT